MNKNTVIFILILCIIPISSYLFPQDKITICKFCELIHQRTYFLLRIESMMQFLSQHPIDIDLPETVYERIHHKKIRAVAQNITNEANLDSLIKMWRDLHEFKYIQDEFIMKDFCTLIIAIVHVLNQNRCPHSPLFQTPDIAFSLINNTYTEALTLRNYGTKRLAHAIQMLARIKCNKDSFFEQPQRNNCICVFESHLDFKHPAIKSCIEKMEKTNSLKPLLTLFDSFSKFKFIQDINFSKEFGLLIFGVYKNLLTYNASHKNIPVKKSTLELIAHLFAHIDSLPLEEILDAIDLLSDELPHLLEEYNISRDTNWKEWFKKYWWVPPIVFTTLGIKVYLIFKHRTIPHIGPQERPGSPVYGSE